MFIKWSLLSCNSSAVLRYDPEVLLYFSVELVDWGVCWRRLVVGERWTVGITPGTNWWGSVWYGTGL